MLIQYCLILKIQSCFDSYLKTFSTHGNFKSIKKLEVGSAALADIETPSARLRTVHFKRAPVSAFVGPLCVHWKERAQEQQAFPVWSVVSVPQRQQR